MKWLRFAIKNVLRNRRRSFVTILIASVGTSSVLVGGGFALYTYESLRNLSANQSGHVVLAHHDYFERDEDTPMQFGIEDHQALGEQLRQDKRIESILPRVQFSGLISNGDKSSVFVGTGVDPEGEFRHMGTGLQLVAGDVLSGKTASAATPEVLLGVDLAKQMKAAPGSGLTLLSTTTAGSLNAIDVKVGGIVRTGVPEVDKRLVYVSVPTAQQLLLTDKVSTLSIYLTDTELTDAATAAIRATHPKLAVQTWRDQAFYYLAVRGLYNRIFGLLGIVIVTIVLFAVSNTLAMAVVERTREIGTLRALGTLPGQIVHIFALEGLVLGAVGAVAGMVSALVISGLVEFSGLQMPPPPGRSVGYPFLVYVSVDLYAITFLCIVALSAAAAFLVSRKAAARPIVEALGHV